MKQTFIITSDYPHIVNPIQENMPSRDFSDKSKKKKITLETGYFQHVISPYMGADEKNYSNHKNAMRVYKLVIEENGETSINKYEADIYNVEKLLEDINFPL